MNINEQEEILKKATEHMVKSINSFGPSETLKLLVTFSNQDAILRELLTIFPSIVSLNHFLYRKPIIKIQMNERALERLLDTNFPFLIKEQNEQEEGHNVRKKASRPSKETRSRKRRIREDPK